MVLLTTLLTPLCLLASFSVKDNIKAYMILFFLLEMGMLGVFLSLDLLLFFVFWEFGLVPMYFLINQWGSEKGEREIWGGRKIPARTYASFKFMIYTMAGSLGLLLAIQMIGVVSGTFDLTELYQSWNSLTGTLFGLPISTVKAIAFWAFAIAFAIKVPVWPFHTWLPDAHTEAPTAGSMILAGVLLKLGAYGFLRLVLPLYPVGGKILCRRSGSPGCALDHLRGVRLLWSNRFQAPGGIFVCKPYGLCRAWYRCSCLCWRQPELLRWRSMARCCRCSTMAYLQPACSSWSE